MAWQSTIRPSALCGAPSRPLHPPGLFCVHQSSSQTIRDVPGTSACVHSARRRLLLTPRAASSTADSAEAPAESLPTPTIKIDNHTDPFSTIVKVDFGERLGDLLDTIQALKNMGYNISRAKLSGDSANKFFITDARTAEKVTQSAELESIRQCIIHNMMDYHPESKELYSTGAEELPGKDKILGLGSKPGEASSEVNTSIRLKNESGQPFTRMNVDTRDRPGLLVDIVRVLKDCSVNVLSAEVDTLGDRAKDEFIVSYHGAPLNRPMRLLVKNSLQYYLALADVSADESY